MKLKAIYFLLSIIVLVVLAGKSIFAQSGSCVFECPGANCRWVACFASGLCCPGDRVFMVDVGFDDVNPCVEACATSTCFNCTGACSCGGCFTGDTPVSVPGGEEAISSVKVGDQVQSFNPDTNEETTSVVEKIYELTREAYYKIKLKDGTEVKVTAEHPLYAIKGETEAPSFWEYLKTESLTRRLVDRIFK